MTCLNPYWLSSYGIFVPCGKCVKCKIARSRDWAVRMVHELNSHKNAVFITLTYVDEFLPKTLNVQKEVAQKFIRRLRKKVSPLKIKYYMCGEYGEKNGRPHYHAIIFGLGLSAQEKKVVESVWTFGHVYYGTFTYQSASYVANYFDKDNNNRWQVGRNTPFKLMSSGLGKEYAIKNQEQLKRELTAILGGKKVGLPRYYTNLLDIDKDILKQKSEENLRERLELHKKRVKCDDDLNDDAKNEIYSSVLASRVQNKKNTLKKLELKALKKKDRESTLSDPKKNKETTDGTTSLHRG